MTVRVILVDAHEEGRQTLARRLESDGRVEVGADVPTVSDARAVLRDGQYDVALMNIQSHEGESIARCQEFGRATGMPLVVLTSFMTVEHWRALRNAGAAAYLLKQGDSRLLCSAIVRLARTYQTDASEQRGAQQAEIEAREQERPLPRESGEHESLLTALRRLENVLATLNLGPEIGWRERARAELRSVSASIDDHCHLAEAPDGLLAQVKRDAGRSATVTAAHLAHEQLCEQGHALAALMSEDVEIDVVRERATEIAKILRRHLDLLGDLVYEAACESEMGVGD